MMSQMNPLWRAVFAPVLKQNTVESGRDLAFRPAMIARREEPNTGPRNSAASLWLPGGSLDQNNK
jgi:hypothetical protein